MFLRTLTHAQTLGEMQNTCTKKLEEARRSSTVISFSVQTSPEHSKGAMKRQEDERIKGSEPELDKRGEEGMMKESKEREMQEEGHCVQEATVTHYFPHRRQRDGVQLFFVSESLREKFHSLSLSLSLSLSHTHTHLPFKQNMAPFFIATCIHHNPTALPLHCLSLSFTPLFLPSRVFGQRVRTQEHKSRHRHARASLPLPLAIVLPLFLRLQMHRVAAGQLLHHKEPA